MAYFAMPLGATSWGDPNRNEFESSRKFETAYGRITVFSRLVDAWQETSGFRQVFKFKLEIIDQHPLIASESIRIPDHDRVIPSAVKLEVWKRDKGTCVKCGSKQNLHFDHVIPYSQGGSSRDAKNIQILCSVHNLQKRDKIE